MKQKPCVERLPAVPELRECFFADCETKTAADSSRSVIKSGGRVFAPWRAVRTHGGGDDAFEPAGIVPGAAGSFAAEGGGSSNVPHDAGAPGKKQSALAGALGKPLGIVRSCVSRVRGAGRESKAPSCKEEGKSGASKTCFVEPDLDVLFDCQGAWERIQHQAGAETMPLLRTFVIIGSSVLFGDGSTDVLLQRCSDGAVLLRGGALVVKPAGEIAAAAAGLRAQKIPQSEPILGRTCTSGFNSLFRRISLPTRHSLEKFQGDWSIIENDRTGVSAHHLQIIGVRWKLGEYDGFLKWQDGIVRAGAADLLWGRDRKGNIEVRVSMQHHGQRRSYQCARRD